MRFFAYKLKDNDKVYTKRAVDIDAFLNSFDDVYTLEDAAEVVIGDKQFEDASLVQINLLLGESEIETESEELIDFRTEKTSLFYIQVPIRIHPIDDLKERIG